MTTKSRTFWRGVFPPVANPRMRILSHGGGWMEEQSVTLSRAMTINLALSVVLWAIIWSVVYAL